MRCHIQNTHTHIREKKRRIEGQHLSCYTCSLSTLKMKRRKMARHCSQKKTATRIVCCGVTATWPEGICACSVAAFLFWSRRCHAGLVTQKWQKQKAWVFSHKLLSAFTSVETKKKKQKSCGGITKRQRLTKTRIHTHTQNKKKNDSLEGGKKKQKEEFNSSEAKLCAYISI